MLWIIPAVALALAALALAAHLGNPDPTLAAWTAGARVVGAAGGAWLVATGVSAAAAPERQLIRYFQQR
ncbi:hypothetical protein [Xylanimonas sp. McL0601]|uniref:hypothetical protein n=1 Tax=Xylanimonas sp. McL0601 TaxID=3414739 RepID=UPI003CEF4238